MRDFAAELAQDRHEASLTDGAKAVMSDSQAWQAASRCLFCYDAPCVKGCPASVDVARFVWDVWSGNVRGAARTILKSNPFGLTCARVCPTPTLCAGACVLQHAGQPPVDIAGLQLYAVSKAREAGYDPFVRAEPTGKKVALVGAGPASLACAHELSLEGHGCTIFEARALPGGLSTHALAPYKITAEQSLADVGWVARRGGIELRLGVEVGKDVTFESLLAEHDALFLGVGLGSDSRLQIEGHELPGVVGALELVERLKLAARGKVSDLDGVEEAIVVGGGATALDLAQELRRLDVPRVTILYRRDEALMPGHAHELAAARGRGVNVELLSVPIAYVPGEDGRVAAVKAARCELGEPGEDGRRSVTVLEKEVRELPAQLVVVAIGQKRPGETLADVPGLELTWDGRVQLRDESGRTDNPRVFAGGDCVSGGRELVHAVAAGRRAARAIHQLVTEG